MPRIAHYRCVRRRVWIGSLAVHAVLGALLASFAAHRADVPARAAAAVEVIDVVAPTPSVPAGGGGGGGTPASTVRSERPRASRTTRVATRAASDDPRGEIRYDTGGDGGSGGGDGGGDGSGRGAGRGAGIGFGDGGGIARQDVVVAVPPAPKVSRARPARLIFPSRQRDVDEGELFVMRVTVDADGYVAGAKLVRGFGGRRDEVAANQIWRFRYDPARDDDGNPVLSVLEQRFLVQ